MNFNMYYITFSFFSCIEARATFSCSTIILIVFFKSTSIVARFSVEVSPTSTNAYICSSLTLHKINAPSSTLICMCFCIFRPSKPFSFVTPPMPFVNLVKACSSYLIIFVFFRLCIYQSGKKLQHKIKQTFYQHQKINKTSIKLEWPKQKKNPTTRLFVVRHLSDWNKKTMMMSFFITTLALGLRPRQGLARLWAKREAWESHLMLPGV